jgi:hypothetical protein
MTYYMLASNYDAAMARETALQARLTVADQRADDLQSELTKAREWMRQFRDVAYGGFLDDDHLLRTQRGLDAFLAHQSAPAAKDQGEKIYEARTSKSAKAPEGLRPDQIVEVYGGGFQQIGSVARTDWRNVEKWRIADTAPAAKDEFNCTDGGHCGIGGYCDACPHVAKDDQP